MKTNRSEQAPTVSGVWRGSEDPADLLIVLHEGRGRRARRQILYPGDHFAPDGTWSVDVTGEITGVWAVRAEADADPDSLLKLPSRALDERSVGAIRTLAPRSKRKGAAADGEGELKSILDLPARPFPAMPDSRTLRAYRDYEKFLDMDLDQEFYRLRQNDLDRARRRFKRSPRHVQVGDILQARLNARESVKQYFHLSKTLLNSVSIDAGNFVERASAWMSLTTQKPSPPIDAFFKLFLQIAGLIARFVSEGTAKPVIDTALSVATIFQSTVKLVENDPASYPNLDRVHVAKAELLGALTDWKRAAETTIDDMQALIIRDASKLERAGRLVFPEKTAAILEAVGKAWGRIIWLKLLPTRTVLVKQGAQRFERKEFNSDEKKVQALLAEQLASAQKGTTAAALRTVTYGYYKSQSRRRKRKKYYYIVPRWTLRLGSNAETDFNLDAAKSLRACAITPHDIIVHLKLAILCFSSTPGIPPKGAANLWTDVVWVGATGRRHYMNHAQWDPVGQLGKG